MHTTSTAAKNKPTYRKKLNEIDIFHLVFIMEGIFWMISPPVDSVR